MVNIPRYIASLSILLILSFCSSKRKIDYRSKVKKETGPIRVEGFKVEPSFVTDKIEVPGSLYPAEETQIKSEVTGRVVYIDIKDGSFVKKGTLLVRLFDDDQKAKLNKLKVQLELAKKNEERERELLKIEGISQQEYDVTLLNKENILADIATTKIEINKREIRAPYDGRIGLRNISPGTFISPTDIITTISQTHILKLEFAVPEKYGSNIQKGNSVLFKTDAGKTEHEAFVDATENSVDAVTRTLKVRAIVRGVHKDLIPGSFAVVNLQLGKNNEALMVPTQAIIPKARTKQLVIYKGDSVHFANVETGLRSASYIQITNGIEPGDTIITSGLMSIRPNTKLSLSKVTSLTKVQRQ